MHTSPPKVFSSWVSAPVEFSEASFLLQTEGGFVREGWPSCFESFPLFFATFRMAKRVLTARHRRMDTHKTSVQVSHASII